MREWPKRIRTTATWTNDCQGKKDFDGPLVAVSTRYWPRTGGFMLIDRNEDGVTIKDPPDTGKCSANASIIIQHRTEHEDSDYLTLVEQDFEAPDQETVQRKVEAWVDGRVNEVYGVLRAHFVKAGDAR